MIENRNLIKFGDAADRIGVTNKTLRNWLQRGQVELIYPAEKGGRNTFSLCDVFVLSLVHRAVLHGAKVRPAYDVISKILEKQIKQLHSKGTFGLGEIADAFGDKFLILYFEYDKLSGRVIRDLKSAPTTFTAIDLDRAFMRAATKFDSLPAWDQAIWIEEKFMSLGMEKNGRWMRFISQVLGPDMSPYKDMMLPDLIDLVIEKKQVDREKSQ